MQPWIMLRREQTQVAVGKNVENIFISIFTATADQVASGRRDLLSHIYIDRLESDMHALYYCVLCSCRSVCECARPSKCFLFFFP